MPNAIACLAFFVCTLLFGYNAFAQEQLVPKKYHPIFETTGDLDKNGIPEKVIVYNKSEKEEGTNGIDREVIIFKKVKNEWTIWFRSSEAVGNSRDGGMMGDPFESIEIKNGILIINQSGGSSWKWSNTDKYRFQNNHFELIGHWSNYGKLCEYWTNVDYNINTGKLIVTKEYEQCNDDESSTVYKKQNETFTYKLKEIPTFEKRTNNEIRIVSPKYKHEIYL
jgi:hypothetical protein